MRVLERFGLVVVGTLSMALPAQAEVLLGKLTDRIQKAPFIVRVAAEVEGNQVAYRISDPIIEKATKAIEKNPQDSKAYLERARAYLRKKDYDRAIQDLTRALEFDPDTEGAHFDRGVAYSRKHYYDDAIQDFNEAITINPTKGAYYLNLGIAYEQIGDHDHAIRNYHQALEVDPEFTPAYSYLGDVFIKLRNRAKGCSYYQKLCDLGMCDSYNAKKANGKCPRSESELAVLNAKDPNIRKATEAIQNNPKDAEAYWRRGMAYEHTRDYKRAIQDYSKALELKSTYIQAYNFRASAYRYQDEYDLAIQDYHQVLELDPDNGLALSALGGLYLVDLKDRKKGCLYYEKLGNPETNYLFNTATELDRCFPSNSPRYDTNYLSRVIAEATTTITTNPQEATAYVDRGIAYADRYDYGRAVQDYNKALEINPDSVEAYTYRARAYMNQGNDPLAMQDLTKALEIDANNLLAITTSGHLYLSSRRRGVHDRTKGCSFHKKACDLGSCRAYKIATKMAGQYHCPD
ncbi:tetratricopeptide repeat protein [Nitrospiraceae bacterium AH_259_D15_M11_P09]|nr:tetratricopeptide repeat protein [Nitrospiraceae bacterium AH_259_D15_M11_P09]